MQQAHHRSIRKSTHKHIVLFPLGGSAIKGKGADFTSNHRVAHDLFPQLSFFLQSDIDTILAFKVPFLISKVTLMSSLWMARNFQFAVVGVLELAPVAPIAAITLS